MTRLRVISAGPGLTFQDLGRPGHQASGLSRGGAADRRALYEAAALLSNPGIGASLEMAGFGGKFHLENGPLVVALTGAPMRTTAGGRSLAWNATHRIETGETLEIGAATSGTYGYLSVAGKFDAPLFMGARSANLNAGIGHRIETGDALEIKVSSGESGMGIDVPNRFGGGEIRVLLSPQMDLFPPDMVHRFASAEFARTPRGNRMGVEVSSGETYSAEGGLSVVSEMVVPGDIQMTGDGAPFILGPECQTSGGYPRIATVIPSDLDTAMQAAPGAKLSFRFVDRDEALTAYKADQTEMRNLRASPKIRDPHDIPDLLSYQLVDGVYKAEKP